MIILLISISLLISDDEHLFMCLVAICMLSLEKCLFRSGHLFIGLFGVFLILCYISYLFILEINPCQSLHLQIFSPILWVVFSFCL